MSQDSSKNFQVVLARLHIIGIRLQHTNFVLKDYANEFLNSSTFLTREPTPEEIAEINKKIFRNVVSLTALFERLVINLYSLTEAHKELSRYIETKGLGKIEKVLSECWTEIISKKDLICRWRNEILAHGKTWEKDEIFAITAITKDTFKAQVDIDQCSGYAVIYIQSLLKNVQEYDEVFAIIKKKHENIKNFNHIDYLKTQPKIEAMLKQTIDSLKLAGLKSDISLDLQ